MKKRVLSPRQIKTELFKTPFCELLLVCGFIIRVLKCQLFNPELCNFYQAVCHRINETSTILYTATWSWKLNVTDDTVRTGSPDLPQCPHTDRGLEAWSSRPVFSVRAPAQSAGPRAAPGRPRRGLGPGRLETTGRGCSVRPLSSVCSGRSPTATPTRDPTARARAPCPLPAEAGARSHRLKVRAEAFSQCSFFSFCFLSLSPFCPLLSPSQEKRALRERVCLFASPAGPPRPGQVGGQRRAGSLRSASPRPHRPPGLSGRVPARTVERSAPPSPPRLARSKSLG